MKKSKIIFFILFLLFTLFSIYSFYPVINYKQDFSVLPGRILITDRFGKIITDKQNQSGYFKSANVDLDSDFVESLLKIEDKNYYSHFGVDFFAKLRAIKDNLSGKKISGASTITEQYIKNKYFQNQKRSYLQKAREAYLALFFSAIKTKDEILKNYLDNAYFGNQIYGLGGAMEVYFQKEKLEELTDEEITILLSLIHSPGIKSLEEKHFRAYFEKMKNRLRYNFKRKIFRLNKKQNIDEFPFITKRVLEQLGDKTQKREIIVKTTIDSDFQEFSKRALQDTLASLKGKNVTNGTFLAYNPKTMEVLAYQGSRDFNSKIVDGQVDVIKSKRQLGSTLKPFLYLLALKSGANIDEFIIDIERQYDSFKQGKTYISQNYSLKEYGLVRLKKALGNSLNNASVRLAREIGLEKVWSFFKKYGIKLKFSPEYYGYSLVLGNPSINLENLVLSYRNLLPEYNLEEKKLNFLLEETSQNSFLKNKTIDTDKYLLYKILSNPDNRDISFGVNSILNTSVFQAVKTGTSSDFRDNVVVSYNPDLIVGVWIGNNDNSSMKGVSGITGAGYLWHQIVEKAISMNIIQQKDYKIPKSIEKFYYCLDSECIRKEKSYRKPGKKYKSSILDNKYYFSDIFEKLDNLEKQKLRDMGFDLFY